MGHASFSRLETVSNAKSFMLTRNFIVYAAKALSELAASIVFFPLWWYSRGLVSLVSRLKSFIIDREKSLAFLVWVKNIHRPMYGQYDWQGRIISFFIRLVQALTRGLAMFFWIVFSFAIFLGWLILPFFALYEIYFQIT